MLLGDDEGRVWMMSPYTPMAPINVYHFVDNEAITAMEKYETRDGQYMYFVANKNSKPLGGNS